MSSGFATSLPLIPDQQRSADAGEQDWATGNCFFVSLSPFTSQAL
jgi:hypothetical protein